MSIQLPPLDTSHQTTGGWDRGYGIFVSDVERGSKADEAGLKRCDQILIVNGQSFEHVSYQRAVDVLRGATHLSITVKSNFLAFKQMLQSPECSPIRGHHRPKLVDLAGGLKPPIHRTGEREEVVFGVDQFHCGCLFRRSLNFCYGRSVGCCLVVDLLLLAC